MPLQALACHGHANGHLVPVGRAVLKEKKAGILGGALLSAIHGATVINTIYQDRGAYTTFRENKEYSFK